MKNLFTNIKRVGALGIKRFKAFSTTKKILAIIAAIILIFAIFQIAAAITRKPAFTLARSERGDLVEIVTETGTIASSGKIDVHSPTNGTIDAVYVANGDHVIPEQELFKVESSASKQESQAAYANYLTAQAALNAAKSNLNALKSTMFDDWDTYFNLATGDVYENPDGSPKLDKRTSAEFNIAQNDWLAAEAKFKDQQTVVSQTQAQVSSTWLLYQATQNAIVTAPSDGIISNLSVTTGTSVSIYSPTLSTKPVLTISKPGATEVVVSLSETDIAKLKEGQEAKIDVDAASGKEYKGVVRRVDTIGTSSQGVIRYNVYIEVINPDDKLFSGMSADSEITTNKKSGVLTVPNSAIKPYQAGRAVRVIDRASKDGFKYAPVKVGIKGEQRTEIVSGISEGQEVIAALSNEQLKRPGLFGM